jgi:murein DD-endopeptidase MepM/ murein hydrolase activator NlpD
MRRGVPLVLALALLLVVGAIAPPARAADSTAKKKQRQQQIGQQLSTLKSQVAEASKEESALLGQLDDLDERITAQSTAVGALDARILAAQNDLDGAQMRLDDLEAKYRQAYDEMQRLRTRLTDARSELRARAVAAYTEGPVLTHYTGAFEKSGVRELAARAGYLDTVVQRQQEVVDSYRLLREEAENQTDVLDGARSQALAQRDVVADRTSSLKAARRQQDAARTQLLQDTNRRAQVLEEVRARKAEFEHEIAALTAESNSIAADLRARQAGQGVRPAGNGVFASPIPGAAITSTFGRRFHPIFHEWRMHTGIDFGATSGTAIRAAADGEVVSAGPRGGYGNATIIDHGGSLATLYAHQSAILVRPGQTVKRGQVIGRVGSTGFATGPHLHFEVRVSGTPVDPLRYL